MYSDRHRPCLQYQQGSKNILLHHFASTNFASLDPTSQRDLNLLFLFEKSCHTYRMCIRKDGNVCLNSFNNLKQCCITRKEMRSLANYVDHSRVLQIKPLNWPAPLSISCMPSTSQRKQLWNYWEKGLNILLEPFVCHLRLWIKNQQGSEWRKKRKSYSMLKSTSETQLGLIFLCIKIPWSENPLEHWDAEINWTPCWNTSSLGQLLWSCGPTEEQT